MERERKVTVVKRGQAPVVNLIVYDGDIQLGDDRTLHFEEEGPFVIVTLEKWQQLFRHAMNAKQTTLID